MDKNKIKDTLDWMQDNITPVVLGLGLIFVPMAITFKYGGETGIMAFIVFVCFLFIKGD